MINSKVIDFQSNVAWTVSDIDVSEIKHEIGKCIIVPKDVSVNGIK